MFALSFHAVLLAVMCCVPLGAWRVVPANVLDASDGFSACWGATEADLTPWDAAGSAGRQWMTFSHNSSAKLLVGFSPCKEGVSSCRRIACS